MNCSPRELEAIFAEEFDVIIEFTDLVDRLRAILADTAMHVVDLDPDDLCIPVRLFVHGGDWRLAYGDPSFDQDHRGCYAAATISLDDDSESLRETAEDLIVTATSNAAFGLTV